MRAFFRGQVLEPESHELCAVYDPKNGRIMHVHEIVRWPGAVDRTKTDVQARALEMAAKHGLEVGRFKTLRLDPAAFDRRKRYRIEPKSLRLIELERTPPLRGASKARQRRKAVAKKPGGPKRRKRMPRRG